MPDDIKFEVPIPAKVMGRWDGECAITVSEGEMKAGSGNSATVNVVPDSMGYEDYYAGFEDAPEWVTVEPAIGKLDRRGGAETTLTVTACPPPGTSFSGELGLVCVLPTTPTKAFKGHLTVDGVATSDRRGLGRGHGPTRRGHIVVRSAGAASGTGLGAAMVRGLGHDRVGHDRQISVPEEGHDGLEDDPEPRGMRPWFTSWTGNQTACSPSTCQFELDLRQAV